MHRWPAENTRDDSYEYIEIRLKWGKIVIKMIYVVHMARRFQNIAALVAFNSSLGICTKRVVVMSGVDKAIDGKLEGRAY